MRIAFCVRSLELGGAEKQLVMLANALAQRGHVITVIVCYSGGVLEKALHGVDLLRLDKKGRWDFSFMGHFIAHLRSFSPDVIHGYLGLGNVLSTVSGFFLRDATVVWGVRASNMDLAQYDGGARLSFYLERLLARFSDAVISNSHAGKRYALSVGYPRERMYVIPNGIDTMEYRPCPDKGASLRSGLGLSQEDVVFGMVGRVDVMKGHDIFLKAASRVVARFPEARFLIVGREDGDFARETREQAKNLPDLSGKLFWMPAQTDLLPVYNAIDVLVSASRFGEGFSNVIGEAMACGVPCLVADVGDCRKIVGDTAYVVPPEDPVELARGMEALLSSRVDAEERGRLARKRIEEMFSPEQLAQASEEVLEALVRCKS